MSKIILDIDGVVRDIHTPICKIYQREYNNNSNIKLSDIKQYDLQPTFPLITNKEEFFRVHAEEIFYQSKPYNKYDVVSIMRLMNNNTVHFVSSQLNGVEYLTENWLKLNGFPYDSLTFSSDKAIIGGNICLDDCIDNLIKVQNKGIYPVCFSRPWNNNWYGSKIKDFKEFIDFVNLYNKNESRHKKEY